ncbi:MAG TPA: multicopper oxidase [Thermomicrobiales bacterium]|nr:multicopper oxidase [Thermomicrobiales bacterium]
MITRRRFLQIAAAGGAALIVPPGVSGLGPRVGFGASNALGVGTASAQVAGPTLTPHDIAKFVSPLVIPPAMPRTAKIKVKGGKNVDYYEIGVRQFQQQILPADMPATTVWGYGSVNHAGTFNYPSFSIEAKASTPVRVKWINQLVNADGAYLPHLLPVDQTLHWANPPGGEMGRDMHGATAAPYAGPVPIVTHIHGAHAMPDSDGFTEAWYLPAATNIPVGHATVGSYYDTFRTSFAGRTGVSWAPGSATFQYENDQPATTLWYHDHTLGMTRVNVYAGPAGFYLVRGGPNDLKSGVLPGPGPALGDPAGLRYYEIPIVIQDRSFNQDGSLFYPGSREFFDEFAGPYAPDSDIAPIWNPEFFGNAIVVNGRTWPTLDVEPRRYRFRLLNGCNSRFLILRLDNGQPFWQIGAEGGFLPAPVQLNDLLMAPAERADVIVDFTGLAPGATVTMLNLGPDEPFGGGLPGEDFDAADPDTTGLVMRFNVVPLVTPDTSVPPGQLVLPAPPPVGPATTTRQVSLNELDSAVLEGVGPMAAMLGTLDNGSGTPLGWMETPTETPGLGTTELWEIYNFTADAHPIHLHQVQFQVVDRQALVTDGDGMAIQPAVLVGAPMPAQAWETGLKDTVIAYPGQVTRIAATFDLAGLYVWHCHIVEHEDNEMMRPLVVS